jgi:hypothetical protein
LSDVRDRSGKGNNMNINEFSWEETDLMIAGLEREHLALRDAGLMEFNGNAVEVLSAKKREVTNLIEKIKTQRTKTK